MPTHRTFEQHLAGLHAATTAFAAHAGDPALPGGLDTAVPTCPGWDVRDLIGHQGYVHRWARGAFTGTDPGTEAAVARAGRRSPDPVGWLRDGVVALVSTLVAAPEDAVAFTFLADAPAPRLFWARRQCHETTIHAVDALAASLGRAPAPDETRIDPDLALDGVDELLLGFVPRSRSRLRAPSPTVLGVVVDDAPVAFTVLVSSDAAPVVRRHDGARAVAEALGAAHHVARADAVTLYLALWHRTPLDAPIWPLWHDTAVW